MSVAAQIAIELTSRLQAIAIANGYQTDIGQRVYRGKLRLDETNMPCAVIVEDDDESSSAQLARCKTAATYLLEGHAACDPDNPNDVGHQVIADLKKAIFSGDLSFEKKAIACRYLGRSILPRIDGLAIVSAHIEIVVEFVENLANP